MRAPSASSAVSLTYALGRSLYVPLTCRCNTVTLPRTRGPGFLLPRDVVASLLEVRRLELGLDGGYAEDIRAKGDEAKVSLPPLDVPSLYSLDNSNDIGIINPHPITDQVLRDDISSKFQQAKRNRVQYDSLVIAGEGEPMLRLATLLSVVQKSIQSSCFGYTGPSSIRVVTNGLGCAIPGNEDCLAKMKGAGVSGLSVALMTASKDQYDELMRPCLPPNVKNKLAHDIVCDFIRDAIDIGFSLEVTGVDRDDVDKKITEMLASSLGVTEPVRWRPYFS